MPLPTRVIGLFAFIFILIVILPMLFIGSQTVRSKQTESLGIAGLVEGMKKNYIIALVLAIVAISATLIWAFVIFNVTPK